MNKDVKPRERFDSAFKTGQLNEDFINEIAELVDDLRQELDEMAEASD